MSPTAAFQHLKAADLISAVQHMPIGVSIVDGDLKIVFCNKAFADILGIDENVITADTRLEDLIRLNALRGEYGPGDPDEQVRLRIALARKFEPHHFIRTGKDGRVIDVNGRIIYDENGKVAGIVTLYQDITREKKYEEELQKTNIELQDAYDNLKQTQLQLLQSEQMASVGHLAAGIAHEINNPIGFVMSNQNALRNSTDVLVELTRRYETKEPELPAASRHELAEARKTAEFSFIMEDLPVLFEETKQGLERIRSIVAHLQTFAHDKSGDWSEADLSAVLDRALGVAANALGNRITVVREYAEVPQVACQPAELSQVFMGMLLNAGQAIEGEGRITLRVRPGAGDVVVEIEDTGGGIKAADLPHIFDPFFTTRPVGSGTGLGLAVGYNVVKKHGGRIEVQSAPGRGSLFRIHLPIEAAEKAA